jgi:hypothetical protein
MPPIDHRNTPESRHDHEIAGIDKTVVSLNGYDVTLHVCGARALV